jgi:hypothetical protein
MSNLDGILLSLMFAIATLAMPGEAGMGKAHAQTPFDGAECAHYDGSWQLRSYRSLRRRYP